MQVPKGLCRTYLTYLAFVCNDAELQPFLPQIIIGNQAVFKARDMERLQSHAPPNTFLVRAKSHWTNQEIMQEVTELLVAIVQRHRPHAYVIWYFDTAGSHLVQENLEYAFEMGLNIVPVPRKPPSCYNQLMCSFSTSSRYSCESSTGSYKLPRASRFSASPCFSRRSTCPWTAR